MPCRVKSNNPTWNVYLRTSVTDSHLGSVGLDLVGAISMGSPIYTLINRPLSECAFFFQLYRYDEQHRRSSRTPTRQRH